MQTYCTLMKGISMKKCIIALTAAVLGFSAHAQVKVADVVYPAQMSVAGQTLQLNGAGLREIFIVDVYAAGLYTPTKAQTLEDILKQSAPQRVRLVLLRDVDANDFVDALNDGLKDNSSEAERAAITDEITSLIAVMRLIGDVKKGDTVDFDFTESMATSVSLNDQLIGEKIGGKDLYEAVLKIWLGPKAIDSGLKKALLK